MDGPKADAITRLDSEGANFFLRPAGEIQPELSVVRDRGTGEVRWIAIVRVVLDPGALIRAAG